MELGKNEDILNNEIQKISTTIDEIKKDNDHLKKIINDNDNKIVLLEKELKILKDKIKNPKEFSFTKNISTNLGSKNIYNKKECIFTSIQDDYIYIVYGYKTKKQVFNLQCYDIINDDLFDITKELHKNYIFSCRYFLDEEKKRDLLITASFHYHVKVVNFKKEKNEEILNLNC